MTGLRRFFLVAGLLFAVLAASLFAFGLTSQWGSEASFDVLGVLSFLKNLGHLFAYFWAFIFACGAVFCWFKAATL